MFRPTKSITLFALLLSFIALFAIPTNALQPRIALNCSYCGTQLTIADEYLSYSYYMRTCPNAPTLEHEHSLAYLYQDQLCLECGYSITVSDGFVEERCSRGNYNGRSMPICQ